MHDVVLVRYDEIGIKGNNRTMFEKALVENIQACMHASKTAHGTVERRRGRIILPTIAMPSLQKVFGISSYSVAKDAGTSMDALTAVVQPFLATLKPTQSFRVTCQRLDKDFPLSSHDVAKALGAFIQVETKARVDLERFDREFVVEVLHGRFYFIIETFPGPGGLPVGTEGTVLALIDSDNAERAALQALKRGCDVVALLPAPRKTALLDSYACGFTVEKRAITGAQDADAIATETRAKALVVGDTLADLKEYATRLPVFRPLVGGIA